MERAGLTHVRSLFKKGYSTFVRMDALGTNGTNASHTRGGSTPTGRSTLALSPARHPRISSDPTPPMRPPASLDPKHDGLTQLAERLTPTVAFGATSPAQARGQGEARFHFFGYFVSKYFDNRVPDRIGYPGTSIRALGVAMATVSWHTRRAFTSMI